MPLGPFTFLTTVARLRSLELKRSFIGLSRNRIDFKTHSAAIMGEIDNCSFAGPVYHGEKTGLPGSRKNGKNALHRRRTDEQDVTSAGLAGIGETANDDRPAGDRFTGDHIVQIRTERVSTENTNREWVARTSKSFRGPFDESGEIIKKGGLHMVFRHLFGVEAGEETVPPEQASETGGTIPRLVSPVAQKRHVIFP